MKRRLLRLWRRAVYCRRGVHRDSVTCALGTMHWECVHCGTRAAIGFVFRGSNKIHQHWPWERPDDA